MDDVKPWYLSQTIWASLISVGIQIASYAGVQVYEVDQNQIVNQVMQIVSAVAGLIAVFGRIRARKKIA